jgi:peptide/nickel transport system permease protein
VLSQILGASIWNIVLVIGLVGWPGIARVIRAQVLTLKERPFIDAARVAGATDLRLIFYHIAPNVLPFSFLYMSLGVAGAIITEAALSFLGLGDASVISWGGMLAGVLTFGGALNAWWWLVPPGLAITVLSLGFYLLGRGFDEIVNPRLRRR